MPVILCSGRVAIEAHLTRGLDTMGLFGTQKVSKGFTNEAVGMVQMFFRHRGMDLRNKKWRARKAVAGG